MPVTINTCHVARNHWTPPSKGTYTADPFKILQAADVEEAKKCQKIYQCSTSQTKSPEAIVASPNGLLGGVVDAWNNHHNLLLRPEDFWFIILSQLSFYITANAEALRSHFVAHEGKKELSVEQYGARDTVDYGCFTDMMANAIGENVKDPKVKDWILPDFTTTTPEDTTVAAVMFMGAMQQYFEYYFDCFDCGIPEITLLGEKDDWAKIQTRLDQLLLWGKEAEEYCKYLVPIFKHIVATFDDPTSKAVVSFWRTIVSRHGPDGDSGGKNADYMTGWITGMFLWNSDGTVREEARGAESMVHRDNVAIDDVFYPRLYLDSYLIPAVAALPVTVREFDVMGNLIRTTPTRMMAGICGFRRCQESEIPAVVKPKVETSGEPAAKIRAPGVSKRKSTTIGADIWQRFAGRLGGGSTDNGEGSLKQEETADGDKSVPSPASRLSAGSGQQENDTAKAKPIVTLKPVAYWWIYEVPKELGNENENEWGVFYSVRLRDFLCGF